MGKLKDTFVRNVKPAETDKSYFDSDGLYLFVSKTGTKSWRIAYRFNNTRAVYTVGKYPIISLAEARQQLLEVKRLIAHNINPNERKKALKQSVRATTENTFEVVALEFLNNQANKWKPSHKVALHKRLKNDIFPHFADTQIDTITAPQLLEVLRKIEARGVYETAHRVKNTVGQVFRYAIATGRAERDITADLKGALVSPKSKNYASITTPKEISLLLNNIDICSSGIVVKSALQIAPYLFVRPSELRCAEWTEFNFDTATWVIPAERMKMKERHIVPLAPQVISILEELHIYTGHSKYLFPSVRNVTRPISNTALIVVLRSMGYTTEQMTIHGFRHMASTLLNEQGYNSDWIERQLAHKERNSVRATYNKAEYLNERRTMMIEWANYLDTLKQGGL